MTSKPETLVAWHSRNHGIEVLTNALALLEEKGHRISRVIYLCLKHEPYQVETRWAGPTLQVKSLPVTDPSSHKQVYRAVSQEVIPLVKGLSKLHINVSPGTPAMHCVWLILHAGGAFPTGTRLWSSQREGREGAMRIDEVIFPVSSYLAQIREMASKRAPIAQYEPEAHSESRRQAFDDLFRYAGVTGAPLLILGERGTGKTRLVETLVANIKQRENVVTVPCGALDSTLAESELFGHVKGAFTGAEASRKGLLGNADGGILFLDEVQDLPNVVQRKLIRFLQDRKHRYRQVGGDKELSADVEVVCASNQPIGELSKRLAPDLFDRLSHLIVTIPPLRECREDLPDDWDRVWQELWVNTEIPATAPKDPSVLDAIASNQLPGNLRDLQRLAVLVTAWWQGQTEEDALTRALAAWHATLQGVEDSDDLSIWGRGSRQDRIRHFRRQLALRFKDQCGTWSRAAQVLKCNERTLRQDAGT